MKQIIVYLLLSIVVNIFARTDITFSELKENDNSLALTHLYYQKYSGYEDSIFYHYSNNIFHFGLTSGTDTSFLSDQYTLGLMGEDFFLVEDFEFRDNDPAKFIYGGTYGGIDPTAYISRHDSENVFLTLGEVNTIEIPKQNDILIYATFNRSVIGLYKKPYSGLISVATQKEIYEVSSFGIVVIKQSPISIIYSNKANTQKTFTLHQNYPNPFNPTTSINYWLSTHSRFSLKVYDVVGREVAVLVNERQPAGEYRVRFDGSDLPSGVYFYRLTAGDFSQSRKMILMR